MPGGVGGLPGQGGSRMSTAAGNLGGEVGVVTPPKQSSQMWGQCAGWGCWLCPAVSGPLTLVVGGGPLPVEIHAEWGAHMGGGAVAPPSLVWAAGSPQCFTVNLCELMVLLMQQATY